jgi:hypothetical protein
VKTIREEVGAREWVRIGCFKRIEFEGTTEQIRRNGAVFEEEMWKELEWKNCLQPRVVR